ncbi:MAG: fumarylacetoacetate hydrolase family protein [Pyrinomonadaceae bacterium]
MKICRFIHQGKIRYGGLQDERVFPLDDLENNENADSEVVLKDFLSASEIQFLPPTVPSKIVCVGRNYDEHAAELGNEVPTEPLLFLKAPSALITDSEAIEIPASSNQVEHEGEIAVVIGRECKNLNEIDNPFDYVFGYACLNDVTARDLQRRDVQFARAKSFDTFCPLGSFIETELDVKDIRVITKVNGIIKQDGRTSQMVFGVDYLIRYISNQMTLQSGDIIATGTPAGVSKLNAGDVCAVEIKGIGVLRNPVSRK